MLYALSTQRASTWFVTAMAVAVAAQLSSFYWRSAPQAPPEPGADVASDDDPELDYEESHGCPSCGHGTLIELDDASRLLGGLAALTPVVAVVCPSCGALSGHVEDPAKIPIGPAHGTALRQSPSTSDHEALEEPTEHEG